MPKRVPLLPPNILKTLKPNPDKTIEKRDGAVPGLRLRLHPNGRVVWDLNMSCNGKQGSFLVGEQLPLTVAREKAAELRTRIKNGHNPNEEKRQNRKRHHDARQGIGTFEVMIDAWAPRTMAVSG